MADLFGIKRFSKQFDESAQRKFAKLSGDFNPLHMDHVVARRTIFGARVCHGIHILLFCLDGLSAQSKRRLGGLCKISVSFGQPIYLDDEVTVEWTEGKRCQLKGVGYVSGRNVIRITADFSNKYRCRPNLALPHTPERLDPDSPNIQEMADCEGALTLHYDHKLGRSLFPNLEKTLSVDEIASLLATTKLVGMHCPGLHSIYSGLVLERSAAAPSTGNGRLHYSVRKWEPRLNYLEISATASGLYGVVKTVRRPEPITQPQITELTAIVQPDEFKHQKALIIGGSRGLGELAAKLLVVGGADVTVTYAHGMEDAARVELECATSGYDLHACKFDITDPDSYELPLDWNYLYYFASPKIRANANPINETMLAQFCEFYVVGLKKLVDRAGEALTHIFYPSTVFIDQNASGFLEYILAKSMGEELVYQFANTRGLTVYTPRLPALETDQTVSIVPAQYLPAEVIMLDAIRNLNSKASPLK